MSKRAEMEQGEVQVKERPILFSGPMVRALLEGRKTQTRRTRGLEEVNKEPAKWHWSRGLFMDGIGLNSTSIFPGECPLGRVGDRLWVREAWKTSKINDCFTPKQMIQECRDAGWKSGKAWAPIEYLADGRRENWETFPRENGRYRQGRFMPRDYSRIALEITEVRVQRLQETSEGDACAEGADPVAEGVVGHPSMRYRAAFHSVWTSINGLGSWGENPWVWALTFKVVVPAVGG